MDGMNGYKYEYSRTIKERQRKMKNYFYSKFDMELPI